MSASRSEIVGNAAAAVASAPAVSVVMAVYNGEAFLAEAIESILTQTFADFEFVIVDDGSTDRSPAILLAAAARDRRVRIITQRNAGLTNALNVGLAAARGEFVARMDADDVSLPARFERQLAFLRDHPACVACGTDELRIDAAGEAMGISTPVFDHDQIVERLLRGYGGVLRHPSLMVRRDALTAVGGYREQFPSAQDLDLYLRLAEVGELANVPDVLLKYRKHVNSKTVAQWPTMHASAMAVLIDAHKRLGRPLPRGVMRWHREGAAYDHTQLGWRALAAGQFTAARAHARFALRHGFARHETWRLALHALLAPAYRPLLARLRR